VTRANDLSLLSTGVLIYKCTLIECKCAPQVGERTGALTRGDLGEPSVFIVLGMRAPERRHDGCWWPGSASLHQSRHV
jgi:hypothetical protein